MGIAEWLEAKNIVLKVFFGFSIRQDWTYYFKKSQVVLI